MAIELNEIGCQCVSRKNGRQSFLKLIMWDGKADLGTLLILSEPRRSAQCVNKTKQTMIGLQTCVSVHVGAVPVISHYNYLKFNNSDKERFRLKSLSLSHKTSRLVALPDPGDAARIRSPRTLTPPHNCC